MREFLKIVLICLGVVLVECGKPGQKAREKCLEYSEYVYTSMESPILTTKLTGTERALDCGIDVVPLIVGGNRAFEKEFPHMAVLGYPSNDNIKYKWQCGASLISEKFVLTAGHCLKNSDGQSPKVVKLGFVDMESTKEYIQVIPIKTLIPHPQFTRRVKYHDIALLEMEAVPQLTPYIRPACLDTTSEEQKSHAIATGFGKVDYYSPGCSQYLMKVELDIFPREECKKFFEDDDIQLPNGLTSETICAGVLTGGKDTCQGDSGGALQTVLSTPFCMYNIIGVTSFGKFCGFANSPAIYTNISSYIQWIESIVWS